MELTGKINWSEGLFMQPHHLQMARREVDARFEFEVNRRLYSYGVMSMSFSDDSLQNYIVAFDKLEAVMPSGTVIDFPGNATLSSLNIRDTFQQTSEPITISLALPLWYRGRGNVTDSCSHKVKKHFVTEYEDLIDETSGANSQPVELLKYNARLVTNFDDTGDLELLPLIRLERSIAEDASLPSRKRSYIPPCCVISGSPALYKEIRDLINQIAAASSEIWSGYRRSNITPDDRNCSMSMVLRVMLLNKYKGLLCSYLPVLGKMHPFELYKSLLCMIYELAVLFPELDLASLPDYNHEDIGTVFAELSQSLRQLVKGQAKQRYKKVPFEEDSASGQLHAKVSDDFLSECEEFYLCITTASNYSAVVSMVTDADKFKFMPKSIAHRPIYGIRLEQQPSPPPELPTPSGACYFKVRVDQSAMVWKRFEQEKELSIHWPDMTKSDYKIVLYGLGSKL